MSANAPADAPALNVPPPPPHVIAPPPESPEPVSDLPPATQPSGSARPPHHETSPRPAASEAKPEVKPGEPPVKPVEPPPEPPKETPPAPPAQLRTPQTADTDGAAKAVQTTIVRARNTLASVNYGPLSNERKKAYNDAKLLLQQAEDALKEGNFVFAQGVAAKAETLAKELSGR
jgi:hypothetical protein